MLAPPPAHEATDESHGSASAELLRRALEQLVAQGRLQAGEVLLEQFGEGNGEGEYTVEFVDLADALDGHDAAEHADLRTLPIEDILRAAGFDVRGMKSDKGEDEEEDEHEEHKEQGAGKRRDKNTRDEL